MHDARFDNLAKLLVEYSIRLGRNETVLIEAFDVPDEMIVALIRAARKAGGIPLMLKRRSVPGPLISTRSVFSINVLSAFIPG